MTTFNFDSVVGTSITFDPANDVLAALYVANQISLVQSGSDLQVTVDGVGTVTLLSTEIGEMTASNLSTVSSSPFIGDGTTNSALDEVGQTVVNDNTNDNSNLAFGMGGGDTIVLGDGDNKIFGGTATTDSSDGGDTITVGTGSNTIYGNAGDDTLTVNGTASGKTTSLFGGLGDDTVAGAGATTAGNLTIDVGPGDDNVAFANAVTGNVMLTGGAGADTLNLTNVSGDATLYGGTGESDSTDGADTVTTGTGNVSGFLNAGADTLTVGGVANGNTQTINTGIGNDTITDGAAAAGDTVLFGGWGNDTVTLNNATTGAITVYGGNAATDASDGDDTININGVTGNVTIYGNSGNDTLTLVNTAGDTGTVFDGIGNDTLNVTVGDNTSTVSVTLADGNDQLTADISADTTTTITVNGFNATDDTIDLVNQAADDAADMTVTRSGSSTVVTSTANTGNALVLSGFLGNFDGTNLTFNTSDGSKLITNYDGAASTLTGSTNNDQLIAGGNGDTLVGGAGGVDKLVGGDGDDTFSFTAAGFADDTATGGSGTDSILLTTDAVIADADFTNATSTETLAVSNVDFNSAITLDAEADTAGIRTVDGSAQTGTNNIANLTIGAGFTADITFTGGEGADTMTGTALLAGNDLIANGNGGNDAMTGGASTDSLSGGNGDDTLVGGAGIDTISGGANNDAITGGTGADVLTGGSGNDNFTFAGGDSDVTNGIDTVSDATFAAGATDTFTITGLTGTAALIATTAGQAAGTTKAALTDVAIDALLDSGAGTLATTFDGAGTNSDVAILTTTDSKTLLVIDVDDDGSFTAGTDVVVDITGSSLTAFAAATDVI